MSSFIYVALVATSLVNPLCSIRTSFAGPGPDRMIILATATAEVLQVAVPDGPEYRDVSPDGAARVSAYRFRVLQAAGGAGELEPGESFLAVPWAYDESCDRQFWEGEQWVPAGAEVVFAFSGGRTSASGELIIDVLGWHSPYPYAEFLKYEGHPAPPVDRSEWLSARDYFSLLSRLPSQEPFAALDREQLTSLERGIREGNPSWSTRFPGSEILRRITEAWAR